MSDHAPLSIPKTLAVPPVEWPTLVLAGVIYGGFLAVTWWWSVLPLPLVVILGSWLIAWHGSLQHEVIHGHPTRWRAINDAIGWVPLALWLPYACYRADHLTHHRDEDLTDPLADPESAYITRTAWGRMGGLRRRLAVWNLTLAGRLIVGPGLIIGTYLVHEIRALIRGDQRHVWIWCRHGIGVAVVLIWVLWVCAMPLGLYLLGFVYCGTALSLIRSYAEHRYRAQPAARTAIVENTPVFGLLFLYNNLHVLHHQRPALPWYRLPALYRRHRGELIALNGGLVYDGYGEVARRFLFTAHDDLCHPGPGDRPDPSRQA